MRRRRRPGADHFSAANHLSANHDTPTVNHSGANYHATTINLTGTDDYAPNGHRPGRGSAGSGYSDCFSSYHQLRIHRHGDNCRINCRYRP